jgi:hypothetical protein
LYIQLLNQSRGLLCGGPSKAQETSDEPVV